MMDGFPWNPADRIILSTVCDTCGKNFEGMFGIFYHIDQEGKGDEFYFYRGEYLCPHCKKEGFKQEKMDNLPDTFWIAKNYLINRHES